MSKVVFLDNPMELVVQAFKRLYPKRSAQIVMQPLPGKRIGCTAFGKGRVPLVSIDPRIPYTGCIDILAHELAHVAAGERKGHGKVWSDAYDAIRDEYHRIIQRRCKAAGAKSVAIDPRAAKRC